jgi:hypothetical protein
MAGSQPHRDRDPDPEEQRRRDLHLWDRELGGYGHWEKGDPDPRNLPGPSPSGRTKTVYFIMMGTCLLLCAIAWTVVYRYSTPGAIAMSAVALVIPPVAAIIANSASATDRGRRRH